MTTMMLGNLLDTQHWHYVTIKRYGREVNFTLDGQTETAVLNGEFKYLDLDKQVTCWIKRMNYKCTLYHTSLINYA